MARLNPERVSEKKHWNDFWKRDRDVSEVYDNEMETRWALVPAVLVQPAAAVGLAAGGSG